MRLHEEYLKRHSLDVPLVCYDNRSTVFLRSKDRYLWRIISISWRQPESWHPGFFDLNYSAPVHNGYHSGGLLTSVFRPRRWYWDNYETSILDFVTEAQKEFQAICCDDSELAAWQMFLYMLDSSLSGLGPDFFRMVEKSLRNIRAKDQVLSLLECRSPDAYRAWRDQVRPMTMNYSEWLVRLFNQ